MINHDLYFRRAVDEDTAAVRLLVRTAYSKWVPVIGREPLPMNANYKVAIADNLIDLLEVNHQLAGVIEMIVEPDCLLIENIAVDPRFQGCGYARLLMQRAHETARMLRLQRLRLYTNKQFESNVDFYLRCGFSIDYEEPFMGGATVYMSKHIAADG